MSSLSDTYYYHNKYMEAIADLTKKALIFTIETMAKTGRPPKDKSLRMDVPLRIMLTAAQKELIDAAAALDLLETAGWARPILLKAAQARVDQNKKASGKR